MADATQTPAAHATAAASAKALLGEVTSPATEAERRCAASQELKDLATSDAAAFAALKGSDVVGACWRLVATDATARDGAAEMVARRDGNGDAVLPSVLDALAELALLRIPSLLGAQMSTLDTVLSICDHAGALGAPSERVSPERLALVAAYRWLAALSTHPVSGHLLKAGLGERLQKTLSLRTDKELLLQCCVVAANVAADGGDQAEALCACRIPRLLGRLLVVEANPDLKDHAVAAINRIARSARGERLDGDELIGPDAFAALAGAPRPACAAEGVWALHILAAKGGPRVAARLAKLPSVIAALEAKTATPEVGDGDSALAQKVAALTLEDLAPHRADAPPPAP